MSALRLFAPIPYIRASVNMIRHIIRHKSLLWNQSRRYVRDKYVGQVLGLFWAFINPMLMIGVYLFAFVFVFRARLPEPMALEATGWAASYTLYLLSGLLPWMGMQETITGSLGAITGNTNLVKQVVFPLEVLPLKILWNSFLNQAILLACYIAYACFQHGPPTPYLALLPILLFVQYVASAGLALLLSSMAPFFRDIKDIINLLCFALIYLMPVFYMPEMLPGIVLIIGIMLFWNTIYQAIPLYNTIWIMVLAYVTLFLPYSIQYVGAAFSQIGDNLIWAGRVLGGSAAYVFRRVTLPLLLRGIFAGWMMTFIISFRELVTASLIAPPNTLVISTFIVREFEQGSVSVGMAMAVICVLFTTGSLILINRFLLGKTEESA